tara:strand:+ start:30 stop:266 length:237 start_codon:yes stop_codon:yes gene_type:complete
MKTLVKPPMNTSTEIYLSQLHRQNVLKSHSPQYRKFFIKWKFLLLTASFFTFIAFSDSPEIHGNICNKFNSEQACNIW